MERGQECVIATVKEKAAHVYELDVVEISVGDGLIDILVLPDTLLEVLQGLLRQRPIHNTHPQSGLGDLRSWLCATAQQDVHRRPFLGYRCYSTHVVLLTVLA